jgi:hypothetical protein
MTLSRFWVLATFAAAIAGWPAGAATPSTSEGDVETLARRIDDYLAASWKNAGVEPAAPADDAEFLRRVYLDLGGRIPSVSRVRAFLDDARPDKRRRLIDELLQGPYYVYHFTKVWRTLLVPEGDSDPRNRLLAGAMEPWVREHLRKDTPYDEVVRDLLTTPVESGGRLYGNSERPNAGPFYFAKEMKPENLGASTARLFLGIKIECAQCHNHPFAAWKREQFWSYAAFFSGIDVQRRNDNIQSVKELPDRKELTIPGTERVVHAAFPDGSQPKWMTKQSTRQVLAEWITRADNPYFARAAANRMWAHFFGSGLADPVDEIVGGQNAPAHPELLDELGRQFAAHHFDLKFLMRAITASRAYQLTSSASHKSQDDPRQFARMVVRGMTGEQLFDSVAEATGFHEDKPPEGVYDRGGEFARTQFLVKFNGPTDKPAEVQTSILQALTLMNGRLISDVTSLEKSEALAAVLDAPFLDTASRVETFYLATLSRMPRPREASRAREFIDAALAPAEDSDPPAGAEREKRYKHALADVFWALLNSGEFFLNH